MPRLTFSQANILISNDLVAQLADFGLSSLVDDVMHEFPHVLSADTTTANRGGAVRWLAPELLGDGDDDAPRMRLSKETDIYSYAMVIIEVGFSFLS